MAASAGHSKLRVDTFDDSVDVSIGDGRCADASGRCSLRAAVQEANASGRGRIVLPRGHYTLSLAGAGEDAGATGDLDVHGQLQVEARGATLDAAGLDRAFDVSSGAKLTVSGLRVTGGVVPAGESGGGFRSAGSLVLRKSSVDGSVAEGPGSSGGAIFNQGGTLLVWESSLRGNRSTRAGGAIEVNGGTTHVLRSTLKANATGPAPGNGGGIHITGAGVVSVSKSRFVENTAAAEGGGLWNSAVGTLEVSKSRIERNVASGDAADQGGGGVFSDGGTTEVSKSRLTGNVADGASGSGGGILNNGGELRVVKSLLRDNISSRAGGGIEAREGTTEVEKSSFVSNVTGPAPGNGGGIHITGAGAVNVSKSRFAENRAAAEGGGLWNSAVGTLSVTRSHIDDNVASGPAADQGGGGVFSDGGLTEISRTELSGNVADGASGSGGGILNNGGELDVVDSSLRANQSQRAGGGIETNGGSVSLDGVLLSRNETGAAPGNGGGLHVTAAGTVAIDGSSVVRNRAANEGGGLWNSGTGTIIVTDTRIARNSAPTGPDVFNVGGVFTIDGVAVPAGP